MSKDPFHVLCKDGVSYVQIEYNRDSYLINGKEPVICKGNNNWCWVEGNIVSIQYMHPGEKVLECFRLKQPFIDSPGDLDLCVDKDSFSYNDDYDDYDDRWCGKNIEFYEPVYEQLEPVLEDKEFKVIDRNCKPVAMPRYVKIDFPNSLSQYPEIQYKYPCRIDYEDVFGLVYEALEKIVQESGGKYIKDSFKNIQTLRIHECIDIPRPLRKTETYKIGRQKRTRIIESKKIEVLSIIGRYKDTYGESTRVIPVYGKNYVDLQKKLAAYIKTFTDVLTVDKRQVCEHCKGVGIISLKDRIS